MAGTTLDPDKLPARRSRKTQKGHDIRSLGPSDSSDSGSDLALCDSETCRWQITHGTGVASKHPIEILADAYGIAL